MLLWLINADFSDRKLFFSSFFPPTNLKLVKVVLFPVYICIEIQIGQQEVSGKTQYHMCTNLK